MNDVLNFLDREGRRTDFTDLLDDTDITEQIRLVRGAVCHNNSKTKDLFDGGLFISFLVMSGPTTGKEFVFEGRGSIFDNPFEDDLAIYFGEKRLFLDRHIRRVIHEAKHALEALALENGCTVNYILSRS